jgi:hypothetical protein
MPAKGWERGSGTRGIRWAAHEGASGGVAAGRRGGVVVVGELSGEGASAWERRREELGEG